MVRTIGFVLAASAAAGMLAGCGGGMMMSGGAMPTGTPVASKDAVNTVPMAAAPVTVDGVLDEAAWRKAIAMSDFVLGNSDKPPVQSRVLLTHDKDNLYVAVINDEPMTAQLTTKATERDGNVWGDDSIEIYVDPSNAKSGAYMGFFVSAANVVYDRQRREAWNGEWTSAVKVHDGKAWVVEVAIPWKTLEATPSAGHTLGLMVARNRVIGGPVRTLYLVPCRAEAKDTDVYPVLKLAP